jgi:hypothetical protein
MIKAYVEGKQGDGQDSWRILLCGLAVRPNGSRLAEQTRRVGRMTMTMKRERVIYAVYVLQKREKPMIVDCWLLGQTVEQIQRG